MTYFPSQVTVHHGRKSRQKLKTRAWSRNQGGTLFTDILPFSHPATFIKVTFILWDYNIVTLFPHLPAPIFPTYPSLFSFKLIASLFMSCYNCICIWCICIMYMSLNTTCSVYIMLQEFMFSGMTTDIG